MIQIKHDVDLRGIQPQMAIAIAIAASVYAARGGGSDLMITSGVEGTHMVGSLHYKGLAVDLRMPSANRTAVRDALADALGPQFDVILEADHVHLEYDPKPHV